MRNVSTFNITVHHFAPINQCYHLCRSACVCLSISIRYTQLTCCEYIWISMRVQCHKNRTNTHYVCDMIANNSVSSQIGTRKAAKRNEKKKKQNINYISQWVTPQRVIGVKIVRAHTDQSKRNLFTSKILNKPLPIENGFFSRSITRSLFEKRKYNKKNKNRRAFVMWWSKKKCTFFTARVSFRIECH